MSCTGHSNRQYADTSESEDDDDDIFVIRVTECHCKDCEPGKPCLAHPGMIADDIPTCLCYGFCKLGLPVCSTDLSDEYECEPVASDDEWDVPKINEMENLMGTSSDGSNLIALKDEPDNEYALSCRFLCQDRR